MAIKGSVYTMRESGGAQHSTIYSVIRKKDRKAVLRTANRRVALAKMQELEEQAYAMKGGGMNA